MVAYGASVVNQIISYKTIFPKGSVHGGSHKTREFILGRAFWLNKICVEAVLGVKIGVV